MVTGASAGVGRAVAHAFARRGARVGLVARGKAGLDAAARECEQLGGTAIPIPTDVASDEQVERAAQTAEQELGPIDVWVNDAMATVFAPVVDTEPAEFRRATEVTYLGTVYGTMAALRRMRARNHGTIVQVGSALAYRAIPLQAAYCGAKFGIRGFTDSLRTELLHSGSGVWVTMVHLPGLNTPQFNWCRTKLPHHPQPVPPIYEPEVPAEMVYYAAHHRRREMYCGGSSAIVIRLNKVAPWAADVYLALTGYKSQQSTSMPFNPDRPDNLFQPVPELAATHGSFSDQAKPKSLQAWTSIHSPAIGTALLGVAGGLAAAAAVRNGRD